MAAELREAAGTRAEEVVRGPKALARRREGIDYAMVPASLRRAAIEPGDTAYGRVRSTYLRTGSPGLVLRPGTVEEVVDALEFARAQDVPLAVRSGGHGISGRSTNDGGIVLDLARLDAIDVDPATGRVRVGPGARWGHVARALAPHGLAISSGDYGDVGVGGLATAGGIGFLGRRFGLTIDRLAAAEVVLADGAVVRADAETRPDLLWALRGAGGNFGIATSFELDADILPAVVFSTMTFDAGRTASFLEHWGALIEAAPRELTSFLYVFAQRAAAPLARLVNVYAGHDADDAAGALTPLLELGPLLEAQAKLVSYASVVPAYDASHYGGRRDPLVSNGFAAHLTPELTARLADGLGSRVAPWLSIRAVGGAVDDVPPEATAYAHPHQSFNVSSVGGREDAFLAHWDELRPSLDGLYLSFETDTRPQRLHDAFPPATLARLRELKARYDPDSVFDQNFPIPPAAREPAATAAG